MRTPLLLAAILIIGLGLWFLSRGLEQAGPGGVDLNRIHDESVSSAVHEPETVEGLVSSEVSGPARTSVTTSHPPSGDLVSKLVIGGRVLVIPPGGTTRDARPRAGLDVEVGPGVPPITTTTDEDGRFQILMDDRGVRPVSSLLTVQGGEQLLAWSKRIDFAAGERSVDNLLIYLQPPPVATGTVRTPAGEPIEGMSVSLPGRGPTSVSNAEGSFTLDNVPKVWLEDLEALETALATSKEGATAISINVRGFDDNETWQPIEIIAAEHGTLEIAAVTREGTPCPGLSFSIDVSPSERYGPSENATINLEFSFLKEKTNQEGVAGFTAVPSGVNLRVSHSGIAHEAVDQFGVLLGARTAPVGTVQTLRASTAQETRVRYLVDQAAVLKGRVFEPEGEPSAGARVTIRPTDAEVQGSSISPQMGLTEEDGTFEIPYTLVGSAQRISIRAQSTKGEDPWYSMFGSSKLPDPLLCAFAEVDAAAPGAELELRLEPMGKITGKVVGPDGKPADVVRLTVLPDEASSPFDFTLLTGGPTFISAPKGAFETSALPPGSYTLVARSSTFGTTRSSGIAHDAENVVLSCGKPDLAKITLTASGPTELRSLSVATGALQVSRRVEGVELLDHESNYAAPLGYQPAALSLSSGITSANSNGLKSHITVSIGDEESKTLELAPGEYWLGVRATDVDGNALFPMGTGPVRIESGEHMLHFEMLRTASLTGHLSKAPASNEAWAIEIHLPAGETVPCISAYNGMQSSFRFGSDGSFDIPVLPACPLEVWIGSQFNLAVGRPDIVRKISPTPGETLAITID